MPIKTLQAFLIVANEEGLTVTEYAKRAGMPITTMSRLLIDMSGSNRYHEQGPNLVVGVDNPNNRRERTYALTMKGRALLARVTK